MTKRDERISTDTEEEPTEKDSLSEQPGPRRSTEKEARCEETVRNGETSMVYGAIGEVDGYVLCSTMATTGANGSSEAFLPSFLVFFRFLFFSGEEFVWNWN